MSEKKKEKGKIDANCNARRRGEGGWADSTGKTRDSKKKRGTGEINGGFRWVIEEEKWRKGRFTTEEGKMLKHEVEIT